MSTSPGAQTYSKCSRFVTSPTPQRDCASAQHRRRWRLPRLAIFQPVDCDLFAETGFVWFLRASAVGNAELLATPAEMSREAVSGVSLHRVSCHPLGWLVTKRGLRELWRCRVPRRGVRSRDSPWDGGSGRKPVSRTMQVGRSAGAFTAPRCLKLCLAKSGGRLWMGGEQHMVPPSPYNAMGVKSAVVASCLAPSSVGLPVGRSRTVVRLIDT